MSQVLKGPSGVRYPGDMKTAHKEDDQDAAKADPLARLLQCHPETAIDYLEFRRMMAGPAAAFAAERATPEDIERLGKCLHAMEEAHELDDPSQEAAADASFHLAIYEASHNQVLIQIMQQFIKMMSEDVFSQLGTPKRPAPRLTPTWLRRWKLCGRPSARTRDWKSHFVVSRVPNWSPAR
jgi:GntR family transcriptional repressor for pyruvate dehydrogenase complex